MKKQVSLSALYSALSVCLLCLGSAAHAQIYEHNGDIIGTVPVAIIGQFPVNPPITVYGNATSKVAGAVIVNNDSILIVTGGTYGDSVGGLDSSVINFSGGTVAQNLSAANNATVNFSGGSVGGNLYANHHSVFNLFGSGLDASLIDPDSSGFSIYSLSGRLVDGTDLSGHSLYVQNGGASFQLVNSLAAVPEPGVLAFGVFVGGCTLGLIVRKRKG